MEGSKRPKLMVKMVNGKYILVPLQQQNNDSQPRAANPILHERVLQEMACQPFNTTPSHSTHRDKENAAIPSVVQPGSSKSKKLNFTQSVPADTNDSAKESTLQLILSTLVDIRKEQQSTNKKVADMEKQIRLIRAEVDMMADRIAPRAGIVRATSFEFEPVSSKDELDFFELQLSEDSFFKRMCEFLNYQLPADSVEARLHASMDILFKRDFVIQISWTGMGQPNRKIPFKEYVNILKLYKFIGTCHGLEATNNKIKEFLQNKFRHSGQRLNLVGLVKSSHHLRKV